MQPTLDKGNSHERKFQSYLVCMTFSHPHDRVPKLVRKYQCNVEFYVWSHSIISLLSSYDFFKTTLLSRPLPFFEYQMRDNLLCHVVSSVLAGTVATSVYFPDVLTVVLGSHYRLQLFARPQM